MVNFGKKYLIWKRKEKEFFSDARAVEARNIAKACDLIQESTIKYDEITSLINEKRKLIVKAKFRYRRVTLFNWIIGFCVGIVASIIATYIWERVINF